MSIFLIRDFPDDFAPLGNERGSVCRTRRAHLSDKSRSKGAPSSDKESHHNKQCGFQCRHEGNREQLLPLSAPQARCARDGYRFATRRADFHVPHRSVLSLEGVVLKRGIGRNVPLKCDRMLNSCRCRAWSISSRRGRRRWPRLSRKPPTVHGDGADDLQRQSCAPDAGFFAGGSRFAARGTFMKGPQPRQPDLAILCA